MKTSLLDLNYTLPSNSTNPVYLFQYINTATDGMAFNVVLFTFFIIIVGLLSRWNSRVAMLGASFVTFVIAVFLAALNIVGNMTVMIWLVLMMIFVLFNWFRFG